MGRLYTVMSNKALILRWDVCDQVLGKLKDKDLGLSC